MLKKLKKFYKSFGYNFFSINKRLLYVDPLTIKKRVFSLEKYRYLRNNILVSGEWDQSLREVKNSKTYKNLSKLYNNGDGYNVSEFEVFYLKKIKAGIPFNHNGTVLSDSSMVRWYTNECISLFESLKKGYDKEKVDSHIGVSITKKGELVKSYNGRHRLVISQLLKLNKIYVCLEYIHLDYYQAHKKYLSPKKSIEQIVNDFQK